MSVKVDLDGPVSNYVVRKPLSLDESGTVVDAAKRMAEDGVGALLVTRRGEPVGMFTERDILNKVVATEKDPRRIKLSEVMSSPVRTVEHSAKVSDAISMMIKYGIRRLGVVKDGRIIGVISQRSLYSSGSSQQVVLPELEPVKGTRCPYCGQEMESTKELSKHIDQIHIGRGLLQGDTSKW
jgi:CBS domain-containing protein